MEQDEAYEEWFALLPKMHKIKKNIEDTKKKKMKQKDREDEK